MIRIRIRFLAGVAAGLTAGALATFVTDTEAWWVAAGGFAALFVWFTHLAAEAFVERTRRPVPTT